MSCGWGVRCLTPPRDLITEYTKLNADRAVWILAQWERFPAELFKKAGRDPEEPPCDLCSACSTPGDGLPPCEAP